MEWLDGIMGCRQLDAEYLIINDHDEYNHLKASLTHLRVNNDSLLPNQYYIGLEDQMRSLQILLYYLYFRVNFDAILICFFI